MERKTKTDTVININLKPIALIKNPEIIGNIITVIFVAPVIPVYKARLSLFDISSKIPPLDIFKAAIEIPAIIKID